MMFGKLFLAAVIAVALGAGVMALSLNQTVTKRVRVDVTVEIEGKELTGSTVWEVKAAQTWSPLPRGLKFKFEVTGDAIALPLSADRALFALRRANNSPSSIAYGGQLLLGCIGTNELAAVAGFQGTCVNLDELPELVLAEGDLSGTELPHLNFHEQSPFTRGEARYLNLTLTAVDEFPASTLLQQYPWIQNLPLPTRDGGAGAPGDGTYRTDTLYRIDFVRE